MSAILCGAVIGSRVRITVTITSNQYSYVLSAASVPGYVAGATDIFLVISTGVYVYSTYVPNPALTLGSGFSRGDSVYVQNNGYILGAGGYGNSVSSTYLDGGPAIKLFCNTTIDNTFGYIGGGGGGGGAVRIGATSPYNWATGGGGAGGGNAGQDGNGSSTPGGPGGYGSSSLITTTGGGGGIVGTFFGPANGPSINDSTIGRSQGVGGLGYGAGGSGCINSYVGAGGYSIGAGGSGGYGGGAGGNGVISSVPAGYIACSGGGGGWGASGGYAQAYSGSGTTLTLFPPGIGGKAVDLNGYTLSGGGGTIWGAVT